MRLFMRVFAFFLLTAQICAMPVYADEISDQIKEALQSYEKGELGEAISALNYAVGQIQEKRTSELKKVFPAPLPGWKAEETSGTFAPMALFGGGVTVSRHYYTEKGAKTVDIEIISDSPLLQSMMAFITNPALLAAQPGYRLIKIREHKAVQKFTDQEKEGEVSVVIRSRMLVTVKGHGLDKIDDLMGYANAIDYNALVKHLEK
jgi:hypothetical protein